MSTDEISTVIKEIVDSLSTRKHVKSISLFGSRLRNDHTKESDMDLLIDLHDPIGYFELIEIEKALSNALHVSVDLVTKNSLSAYFRDDVIKNAVILYTDER